MCIWPWAGVSRTKETIMVIVTVTYAALVDLVFFKSKRLGASLDAIL